MGEMRNKDGLTEREYLEQYNPEDYEKPSVTTDILIFSLDEAYQTLKLLLIKRNNHPFMNCWALPGGFMGISESAYEAAIRELKEETGIEKIYMEQLYTYTNPSRDPRMRVVDIAYIALLPRCLNAVAGDDAIEAAWFDVKLKDGRLEFKNTAQNINILYTFEKKEYSNGPLMVEDLSEPKLISDDRLAFDHAMIVADGIRRIRNKSEYTDIIFGLMDKEFTLTDLLAVYNILSGKNEYQANFRRKIKNKIEPTGREDYSRSCESTRTSALYQFKNERER